MIERGINLKSFFLILLTVFILNQCASDNRSVDSITYTKLKNPAGDSEKILDEKGEVVENNSGEPKFFSKESSDTQEYFRVIISSDSYQLRQIRGTENVMRKPDLGGDQLICDELKKFNLIDFVDDGIVLVKLNGETGKLENFNFHTRVPRINDIAKIIQNDATRWNLEHKKGNIPVVTKYLIYYNIILKNKSNREEVKNKLKREIRK
ncbi:MAG: hypothetical protein L6Q54_00925 [Leptospiraceae bacterium]|nr:hypothetical protein [Leptospiraceae bacterium]MCK6379801.1 hypothetical protein [Leptospiraceae bacterium]NUM41532.1 hypothetical protein [Leptospiraceae bacterium]